MRRPFSNLPPLPALSSLILAAWAAMPLVAGSVHAAEAAPPAATAPADFVALAPAQAQALGVDTQALTTAAQGLATGLPGKVVVPVEQLRVVAAPLAGLVTQVNAVAGQTVKKGQVLARLASPGLLQVQRDYQQARQQADLAKRSLDRDEQLYKEGIIAEARLQASRAGHEQAAVAAAALQAELRIAGAPTSGSGLAPEVAIAAPLDGEVLEAGAAVGARVDQAAPLFTVGRLNPLWVEIQVPAGMAPGLAVGQPVRIPAAGASGKVINVGRQISAGSQTITLRARLDTGTEALRPGQMVEANVESSAARTKGPALYRVPQGAVVRQAGAAYLFIAETAPAPGYRAVPVTVSGQAGNDALVSGPALAEGRRVAVKGLSSLKSAWSGAGKGE